MSNGKTDMEKIVALCKRRGFIFQSSEIYGGIGGFWDYGPLGTELKRNIKDAWWNDMVRNPPPGPNGIEFQMVGLDCSIIMNPKVWEASGHASGFVEPMVDCKECKARFRADQIFVVPFYRFERDDEGEIIKDVLELDSQLDSSRDAGVSSNESRQAVSEIRRLLDTRIRAGFMPVFVKSVIENDEISARFAAELTSRERKYLHWDDKNPIFASCPHALDQHPKAWAPPPCPGCGATGSLTDPRAFNLMFKTCVGALEDASAQAWLRPETAQGIFTNFKNVMDSTRVKIPFGIGQIGKAFRNEINPRNYTFRSREFEQMEIEFFCKPDTSMMWYEFWRDVRIKWYESLGIKSDKLRARQQDAEELAHYSEACTDIEYLFPFSDEPQELEGVAHRGNFDLCQHGKFAKGKENAFAVIDDQTKERFVPQVIEPSAGVDRFMLAVICEAYTVDESRPSPELLKFHPRLAPIKAAVFPLVAKDGMPEIAEPIYRQIKKEFPVQYDAKQSIGKRYARMDEAGTPYCFTIDGQTKSDNTVTVRDRDTGHQERIGKESVGQYLRERLGAVITP